jgi:hypothetical protein
MDIGWSVENIRENIRENIPENIPEQLDNRGDEAMSKSRAEMVELLRAWSARAQHEAQYADTHESALHWQGQAAVLSGVANYLTDQNDADDFTVWRQVVGDREQSLAEWMVRQDGADGALFAGQVAGFDLALTILKDPELRNWPKYEPHAN